ncbi:autophagy protein Apg6, putative [Rhizoctonia solani AG-3 Rhs1AP]|uniref:Autophagy protein Apg6, putative n=2 Tax=Rhizoctonia solani AG-3 TaxID=1086053 RepID=X8JKC8_9AGAM|nr:autophagy protein Apg6, putative [Rhizoctonia solani AG-3 Rhs1AP]KEP52464.1 putative autophagy protein Apg6 [Rhizoctonia solani 123E]
MSEDMSFVCQQCKQPLQLDPSLAELAPSAVDMVAASLGQQTPRTTPVSPSQKLASLAAPSSSKSAWQKAQASNKSSSSKHRPAGESFVLLQDSVVHKIPTDAGKPGGTPKAKQRASTPTSRVPSTSRKAPPASEKAQPGPAATSPTKPPAPPVAPPRSHHLAQTLKLYTLLSNRTDLDHPLCTDCTSVLISALTKQLEETKRERDGYIAFERDVRNNTGAGDIKEMEAHIEQLKLEEKSVLDELLDAEREKAQLDRELEELGREEKELEEKEAEFWRLYNANVLAEASTAASLRGIRAAQEADAAELARLSRANVYNDAFCIGHDGVFGTINGLRLGRVTGVAVPWPEVNAAWGQALLLLHTIARKVGFVFEQYRLVPMGSCSRIEKIGGDKAVYELFGSGELHIGRLLHNRRFDYGMVAFLECLRQIMEFAKTQESSEFPHAIVKDKIGDASIKWQFNQEETWTRALRHVLLALKILLKWATA